MTTVLQDRDERAAVSSPGLAIEHLSVAYGGNKAVSDISLDAPLRRVTGLIGPNGAGKTTTFNACSGFVKPTSGRVELLGSDVTRINPAGRARRGLGRTFQRMELVNAMSVRVNVALGAECLSVGSNPWRQVFGTRSQRRSIDHATEQALAMCGIADLANRPVGTLSTGQRRLVELARVQAGGFSMLLLDEPSSGLDEEETAQFGAILRKIVAERGTGILLVEHDMALIMSVCQYIYVLDFGQLIFDGTPAAVQASPLVRAAYLGEETTEVGGS
jgi:ABC-type branched-subunit amino acid transport system ATPase component